MAHFCATPKPCPLIPFVTAQLRLGSLPRRSSLIHLNSLPVASEPLPNYSYFAIPQRLVARRFRTHPLQCSSFRPHASPSLSCSPIRSSMALLLTSPPCHSGAVPFFAIPTPRLAVRPGPFHSIQSYSVACPGGTFFCYAFALRRGSGLSQSAAMRHFSFPCPSWAMLLGADPFRFLSGQLTALLFRSSAAPVETARGLAGAFPLDAAPCRCQSIQLRPRYASPGLIPSARC